MTPGARLAAAIDICGLIWSSTAPPDDVVRHYFRSRRYAGGGDRRAVFVTVFDLLRRHARLDWWIERSGSAPDDRKRTLADLLLTHGMDDQAAARLFAEGAHAPGPLDDGESIWARSLVGHPLDHPAMPPWVHLECPSWLYPDLQALWGERTEAELLALNQPAPVDLRVNIARTDRLAVAARLGEEGLIAEPTPYSPWGLRLAPGSRLESASVLADGSAEIQDEGSQIVAALVDAQAGMTVVDLCAGAGGKTLALGSVMAEAGQIRGRLVAADAEPRRLAPLADRLNRARLSGVEIETVMGEGSILKALSGTVDRILVDAPCTGSGTWRRRPDLRWRHGPETTARHTALQDSILDRAAALLRPGGRLIYATCALSAVENEERVKSLLARQPSLAIVAAQDIWTGSTTLPATAAPFVRLSPAATGTDGFFCAILARAA